MPRKVRPPQSNDFQAVPKVARMFGVINAVVGQSEDVLTKLQTNALAGALLSSNSEALRNLKIADTAELQQALAAGTPTGLQSALVARAVEYVPSVADPAGLAAFLGSIVTLGEAIQTAIVADLPNGIVSTVAGADPNGAARVPKLYTAAELPNVLAAYTAFVTALNED